MNEVLEAIYKAAIEQIVTLLNDPDPLVRLEAAIAIIGALEATPREESLPLDRLSEEEVLELAREMDADRDDMAEVQEFPESGTTLVPATGEVLEEVEKQLAAAQALQEQEKEEMPEGFKSGRSAIGAGEIRR